MTYVRNGAMLLTNESKPERRSSIRLRAEIRVSYSAYESKLLVGYSIDLSSGGVFLVTECPFGINDILRLRFYLPGEVEKAVSCDARVAWINHEGKSLKPEYPTGVGLQFVNLSPNNLSSIVKLLEVESA